MVRRFIAVAILALFGSCTAALAAPTPQQTCGGDVGVSGTISGYVDPFSPAGSTVTATITVARTVLSGQSATTRDFYFYFVPHSGTFPSGSTIDYMNTYNILNLTGSLWTGLNNNTSNPAGQITADAASGGYFLHVGFGSNNNSESYTVQLTFTLGIFNTTPAGLQSLPLDIYFECKGTGSQVNSVDTPTLKSSGASITLNVLSGLQATYAGPALDFGDITSLTTATVSGSPASYTKMGNFDVKSSGAFQIELTPGNSFLMTPGGTGSPAFGDNNAIAYSVGFLGLTRSHSDTSNITVSCNHVGVSSFVLIPIEAWLLEGGAGKAPGDYKDTVTVTFTPSAASTPDPGTACQSIPLPTP